MVTHTVVIAVNMAKQESKFALSVTDIFTICFIKALLQEIAYAVHLGLPAIMVHLKKQPCTNLAALINGICFDSHVQQVN